MKISSKWVSEFNQGTYTSDIYKFFNKVEQNKCTQTNRLKIYRTDINSKTIVQLIFLVIMLYNFWGISTKVNNYSTSTPFLHKYKASRSQIRKKN